jgi:hypothetical protein
MRKIRVQVGYSLSLEGMSSRAHRAVSLREVKEGLARESRDEAELRERKRKWIISGGSYEEDWARKKVKENP